MEKSDFGVTISDNGVLSVNLEGSVGKFTWELPQERVVVEDIKTMPAEPREVWLRYLTVPLAQTLHLILGVLNMGGPEAIAQIENLKTALGEEARAALAVIQDLRAKKS